MPGLNFGLITNPPLLPRSWPLNRAKTPGHADAQALEDGFAADSEEPPVAAAQHNKRRRSHKSWFLRKRRSSPIGTPAETMPMSPTFIDSPRGGSNEGANSPSPPSGSSAHAHRYPPNRHADADADSRDDDGIGAMATTAAKVLKTAMLHDARNIKGKEQTTADLGFAISSPHEAKASYAP